MATARLLRAAQLALAQSGPTLLPGTDVEELTGDTYMRVQVGTQVGWLERAALQTISPSPPADGVLAAGAVAAGDSLPGTSANPHARSWLDLRPYNGTNFIGTVVADFDFHISLQFIDQLAGTCGVRLNITSSFRSKSSVVVGAIVSSAQRSNHLVGHAIDMNVLLGNDRFDSTRLMRQSLKTLPAAVRAFIDQIRSHPGLRWGGDFVRADPVHIDDDLSRKNPDLWDRKLADAPA